MDLGSSAIPPRRLLIVGDPALSRGLMKMVLSRLGYVVTCVVTGRDCLMTLAHSQFALALIALGLPDLPGLTLATRLRDAPAPLGSMPIIMFGDAWDAERIREQLPRCRSRRLHAEADLDRAPGLLDPRPSASSTDAERSPDHHADSPSRSTSSG